MTSKNEALQNNMKFKFSRFFLSCPTHITSLRLRGFNSLGNLSTQEVETSIYYQYTFHSCNYIEELPSFFIKIIIWKRHAPRHVRLGWSLGSIVVLSNGEHSYHSSNKTKSFSFKVFKYLAARLPSYLEIARILYFLGILLISELYSYIGSKGFNKAM